jgi:hypothetical protein
MVTAYGDIDHRGSYEKTNLSHVTPRYQSFVKFSQYGYLTALDLNFPVIFSKKNTSKFE